MAWLTILVSIALLPPAWFAGNTVFRLIWNYSLARTIGLPIRMIPISPLNPFWVLMDNKVLPYFRRLPFGENSFTRYNWRGWELKDRCRSHTEMGDVWVLVTPLYNWIYVNDPEALMTIFKRGTDFPRPGFVNEILSVFGPNISSAGGQSWKTQRRIANHCFNEQNNEIVWSEALNLANDMLRYWSTKSSIKTADQDLRTLSLHTLSRAGFGKSFKFEGYDERLDQATVSPSTNYKESLQTILENLMIIVGFGTKFLANPWLPKKFRTIHEACVSFQAYMTALYEEEKHDFAQRKVKDHNLMTSLVRASQSEAKNAEGGLTESEIYGNMFAFNFAGHDTTANTFTFALYFLAAHPDVQDWVSEEIQAIVGDRSPQDLDYRADYPRFKRCLAVLHETLRLYTAVPVIKWTDNKAQSLTFGNKTITLPPYSMIAPSYGCVQVDPRFWGSDGLTWRPSRWIKPASSSAAASGPGNEEMITPVRGSYIAWSEGTRDCPGRKFSQVEFAATMAVLFGKWRVDPVPAPGQTLEAAREYILDLIENDSGPILLLQLLHPERAPLVWRQR